MHHQAWVNQAIHAIEADFTRSADTHLRRLDVLGAPGVHLHLKDESPHPTGGLTHRPAQALCPYDPCNGWNVEGTTVVEASLGSTAVSGSYSARLLGLPFSAVMPRDTSPEKIAVIRRCGGARRFVDHPAEIDAASRWITAETGGRSMDQLTFAERVSDWRGNNIAASIFGHMAREPHPVPAWAVCSAGTGGTAATRSRFVRYQRRSTKVCVVAPDNSVFLDYRRTGGPGLTSAARPEIEEIGRSWVAPSFVREIVDTTIRAPDAATCGAALPRADARPALRRLHEHQHRGRVRVDGWHACRRRARFGGHAAVRLEGTLPAHLQRRRLTRGSRPRHRAPPRTPAPVSRDR